MNKKLDYERKNSYTLTIQVEDSGPGGGQYDTASVTILLVDTNDNAPLFEHSPYTVHVLEEEDKSDLPMFTVQAVDRDGPQNNEIEYGVRAGGRHDHLFHVNSSTGQIFVKSRLDREKVDRLTLEVIAIDSGSPRLTGTGTVYVIVDDVNDHAPHFENDAYMFSVSENSPLGTIVDEAIALDEDHGDNALIQYSVQDTDYFSINDKGQILVKQDLDRETIAQHNFVVVAVDSSRVDPKSGSATVTVNILDENDNRPSFDMNSTDFFVPPGLKPGDFVLGLFGSDLDEGDNAKLSYSLSGKDAAMFSLNRLNGVMTASRSYTDKKSFDVTVTASDSRLRREARLSIYLAEELVVPRFDDGATPPEINLDEDMAIGSNVVTFRAQSPDNQEAEEIQYAVAGGNIGNSFDIDTDTGIVFVNQTLDYETTDKYELWIKTFFKTRPLFSAAKKISVVISDKNDNPPYFETPLVKVSVPEGVYPPFDITELYAFDADTGENAEITYQLVGENAGLFIVDDQTGLIRCTQELDREVLDRYTLELEAVDHGTPRLSSTATILLTVSDVNDNPPRFTRLYSLNVTENTAIGTNLLKVETVDKDSPENANVTYNFIDNPDDAFAIHPTMGNISIVRNLDREVRDEYALRVQAFDGTWKLETVITVTIQDDNDNRPTFDQDLFEFVIPYTKDSLPGKTIGRVHALDRDALGPNSAVTYAMAHASDFFEVDENSGSISTKRELQFRTSNDAYLADNSYHLRVIATDGGSPPMSSECEVAISLVSGNNNKPKFSEFSKTEVGVPESISVGTPIYGLNATDLDVGSKLTYKFEATNSSSYFGIDPSSGEIRVLRPLSGLSGTTLQVRAVVHDQGVPVFNDDITINFFITGDNLYNPDFQSPTTRIYIREDEHIGNTIITVKATDQDNGLNGAIQYSIVRGDPKAMFAIDKVSGSISVQKALDYEKIPVYNIIVEARDQGFFSRSATSSVKIILQDVDDNPPKFDDEASVGYLTENMEPGTVVTQMIANDLDSAKNADIEYELLDNTELFDIDSVTGIVTSKVTFNYETTPEGVEVNVKARNPKNPKFYDITTLKVVIRGQNEFFPRFKQPVFQFAVSESVQDGGIVGQVEAVDNDEGEDGEVFYYFVGSSNGAGFRIDRRTGVISVRDELDRESQNRYVLTVLAKNRGSIKGNDTDEAQVIVQVQDGNDPPVFRRTEYRAKISESAPLSSEVVTVSAVDKDVRPRNSQFIYAIADGNVDNAFSIGSSTGVISVEAALNRENIAVYNLTVHAVDNGSPPAIGETRVIIELSDINDSPPVLENNRAFIKENSPPNSFIAQLTATDPDLPPNAGPFKFYLLPGGRADTLSLNPDTGVLRNKVSFDREEFDHLEVAVEIQDGGSPSLSERYGLTIDIGDENDNPSKPRRVLVIIKNFEGTFPGGVVMNVRPDDPDVKGNYRCELISGPENIFRVDPDCVIKAGRIHNGREYDLRVLTNDGKHSDVEVTARLNFVSFSEFAVRESVSVRFNNTDVSRVLAFFEGLKASVDNKLIELLSLNKVGDDIVECFVASRENDLFLPREDTIDYLNGIATDLEFQLENKDIAYDYDPCDANPCLHDGLCSKETLVLKRTEITEAGNTIFNSPVLMQNVTCECQAEYTGDRCQTQKNPCVPNPCQDGGQCFQENDSFRCLCPSLRGGKRCELQKTNACLPNPCLNGGSCQNAKQDGNNTNSFF